MKMEEIQLVWDTQKSAPLFVLDQEAFRRTIEEKSFHFRREIKVRDYIEIITGLCLVPLFIFFGICAPQGIPRWPYFLTALGCLWVASFFFYDRRQQRKREDQFDITLKGALQKNLYQVEHQIKLLSNILWWYILPIAIGAFFVFYTSHGSGYVGWMFFGSVLGGTYYLNKRVVKKKLIPRKHTFSQMLKKLEAFEDINT